MSAALLSAKLRDCFLKQIENGETFSDFAFDHQTFALAVQQSLRDQSVIVNATRGKCVLLVPSYGCFVNNPASVVVASAGACVAAIALECGGGLTCRFQPQGFGGRNTNSRRAIRLFLSCDTSREKKRNRNGPSDRERMHKRKH